MSSRNSKKYLETNENEHTTTKNLWDTAKAVLRGKFILIQAYLKKKEKFQINSITLHLQEVEEEQQKRKLKANNADEYRCKNPQQNIGKLHPVKKINK